jgi:predicted helicase
MCVISSATKEQNRVFPLWTYSEAGERTENLKGEFRSFLDRKFDHHYSAEEVFGYVYAILYAPSYRSENADALRIGFPHIPVPEQSQDFEELSELGWELVQAHLLKEFPREGLTQYYGKGDHTVESVSYSEVEQAIKINKDQSFTPVPEAVWKFHIGGYQVLDKYLKSRKGRKLSLDEINHVSAIADSLAFTIAQMERIDAAYLRAFPNRG